MKCKVGKAYGYPEDSDSDWSCRLVTGRWDTAVDGCMYSVTGNACSVKGCTSNHYRYLTSFTIFAILTHPHHTQYPQQKGTAHGTNQSRHRTSSTNRNRLHQASIHRHRGEPPWTYQVPAGIRWGCTRIWVREVLCERETWTKGKEPIYWWRFDAGTKEGCDVQMFPTAELRWYLGTQETSARVPSGLEKQISASRFLLTIHH